MSKHGREGREMSDAEIDTIFNQFTLRNKKEATKAVNTAAKMYAARLSMNAPRDENKKGRTYNGEYRDPRHSADHIKKTRAKVEGLRPTSQVGFHQTKGLGWYMRFPDGGTVVRGSIHQEAQNFIERTYIEMEGPIVMVFKNALRKASG